MFYNSCFATFGKPHTFSFVSLSYTFSYEGNFWQKCKMQMQLKTKLKTLVNDN